MKINVRIKEIKFKCTGSYSGFYAVSGIPQFSFGLKRKIVGDQYFMSYEYKNKCVN